MRSSAGLLDAPTVAQPADVLLLDGSYAVRPELADIVDLGILLTTSESTRLAQLRRREGGGSDDAWARVWHGAEDYYFTHVRPPEEFDLVVAA